METQRLRGVSVYGSVFVSLCSAVVSAVSGLQVPASLLDDSGLPKITNGEQPLQRVSDYFPSML